MTLFNFHQVLRKVFFLFSAFTNFLRVNVRELNLSVSLNALLVSINGIQFDDAHQILPMQRVHVMLQFYHLHNAVAKIAEPTVSTFENVKLLLFRHQSTLISKMTIEQFFFCLVGQHLVPLRLIIILSLKYVSLH